MDPIPRRAHLLVGLSISRGGIWLGIAESGDSGGRRLGWSKGSVVGASVLVRSWACLGHVNRHVGGGCPGARKATMVPAIACIVR